jgi:leucyl/phenylalanyl-tRNA--protein transferase
MLQPPPHVDPDRPCPDLLAWAYSSGIFPMVDPQTGEIDWYSPDPRGIIPLDGFRVPDSLARLVRGDRFEIRVDTAFEQVIRACAAPRADDRLTWIDQRLIEAYTALHRRGHAHCIEAYREGRLVGGLYGVSLGAAFFGESMFVRAELGGSNASKVALVWLVRHLRQRGYELLDTQFWNPHLEQFGCTEIPRADYLRRLASALRRDDRWGDR